MNKTVVRCPYCAEGEEFRPMVAHQDGRFICAKCGHLAKPSEKAFKCSCPKCLRLSRPAMSRHRRK
jgi:ribosomal protein S27AE